MRQLVYTMFVTSNHNLFHLWWHQNIKMSQNIMARIVEVLYLSDRHHYQCLLEIKQMQKKLNEARLTITNSLTYVVTYIFTDLLNQLLGWSLTYLLDYLLTYFLNDLMIANYCKLIVLGTLAMPGRTHPKWYYHLIENFRAYLQAKNQLHTLSFSGDIASYANFLL